MKVAYHPQGKWFPSLEDGTYVTGAAYIHLQILVAKTSLGHDIF